MDLSPDVNVPAPTEEERALQQEQTALLRQQSEIIQEQVRQQELLAPILYEQVGVTPQYDEAGRITGFTKEADPNAQLRQEIETGFLQRTQAALAGELPVDPALTRQLSEQEATLREQLRSQLGSGFETSTPGIQALSEFNKRKVELEDAARRGDLTLAEQLGIAREQATQNLLERQLATQQAPISSLFGGAQQLGSAAQGFQMPLSNMFNQRNLALQGNIAQAQAQGSVMQGLGSIAGMALFACSKAFKVNKRPVLEILPRVEQLPVEAWEYNENFEDQATHIGPYAEDFQRLFGVGDGTTIHAVDAFGVCLLAIQELYALHKAQMESRYGAVP